MPNGVAVVGVADEDSAVAVRVTIGLRRICPTGSSRDRRHRRKHSGRAM